MQLFLGTKIVFSKESTQRLCKLNDSNNITHEIKN